MQQWEYGYLYIVGFNLREWPARPPGSERRVAVVADGRGKRILAGMGTKISALNALGNEGWMMSEAGSTTSDNDQWREVEALVTAAEPKDGGPVAAYLAASYFMRRPI